MKLAKTTFQQLCGLVILLAALASLRAAETAPPLTLARDGRFLVIRGAQIPGGEIRVNYLEAYCRAGSTDADWMQHTVIKHTSELLSQSDDGTELKLRDTLADGVTVEHTITARADELDFRLVAHNPGANHSEAHWAQPCVRLSKFTGFDEKTAGNAEDYLPKCFLFLDGKLTRMPTPQWAMQARYTPGQVWRPANVPPTDVNPRPLNPVIPSNGLIGCFSGDEKMVFAIAWEPYQELFQGVIRCVHSDFRIGGWHLAKRNASAAKSTSCPMTCPLSSPVTKRISPNTSRSADRQRAQGSDSQELAF